MPLISDEGNFLRIISANIDGIDRAINYGFFEWLTWQNPDVVCLQEINAPKISPRLGAWLTDAGFEIISSLPAKSRKGAGVAILSRHGFDSIGLHEDKDLRDRGQIVSATIQGINIASVYVSYGNTEEERREFGQCFDEMRAASALALLCGDFNILAERRDSHLWYSENTKGYRPGERIWFNGLLADWHDAVRLGLPAPDGKPLYTWWSNKGACYVENRGTRPDYQLATPNLAEKIVPGSARAVCPEREGKRVTDHAALLIDFEI